MAKKEKKPSYLKEMLTHPINVYSGAGALTAAAALSIPFGLGIAALPLVAFAAADGIASLFIPNHRGFKERVDRKWRAREREKQREHLIKEIDSRVRDGGAPLKRYNRMCERLESLRSVARDRMTSLSDRDVEKLDDATVGYLGLWLARLVMAERRSAIDERDIVRRLKDVNMQIQGATSTVERRRLEKAREDLERIKKRLDSLESRVTAVEAAMLASADAFEEAYQQVVTNPSSHDLSEHLNEAVDRLQIEESLDVAIEEELGELAMTRRVAQ